MQLSLIPSEKSPKSPKPPEMCDPTAYDTVIVAFSGGKDSTACVLDLLERGVDPKRMELWHHDIDGREGPRFMDWACTRDYCRAFAKALGIPLRYSWKEGGFSREMLRDHTPTAPTHFEDWYGIERIAGGKRGKPGTRLKFPQVSANLSVRWCSAYLKIDVCSTAIRNQARFVHSRTLLVSGERAEESAGRAKYAAFEVDRADRRDGKSRRHVDRYRPVHQWSESMVWDIIRRHGIRAHPAYYIGWGRVSCAACIFGSKHQWASLHEVDPDQVERIARYEEAFGVTINRTKSVRELVREGTPYPDMDRENLKRALSGHYDLDIILEPDEWTLPAGAFGESCGPT